MNNLQIQDVVFPSGGGGSPTLKQEESSNPYYVTKISENYMKIKKIGSRKHPKMLLCRSATVEDVMNHNVLTVSVADPGFPQGRDANSLGVATQDLAKISLTLHEIERFWMPGGGGHIPRSSSS